MKLASLNRWKASLGHLAISAAIGITVVTLMLVVWYPRPYFKAMGGDMLIPLLIGVDVVIGPLITLIIFDPKKRRLKFDLSVIATMQLAALAYGCNVMFASRPVYNVFVVLADAGRTDDAVGFLPMKARSNDMTVLADKKTGDMVGILPVYPW